MRRWLLIGAFAVVSVGVFAGPVRLHGRMHGKSDDPAFLRQEIEAILAAGGGRSLGQLSVEEIHDLLGQLSVARQKDAFVQRSQGMSFMLPGMGQFVNRDPLSGSLFLTADLLVTAGTLVGAYYLLPAELQFSQLNYFTAPYSTIRTRWENQSFVDLLPTMGVLAGGWLVGGAIRYFSARHAGELARRNVADGTVTFEPDLLLLPLGPGSMGLGMKMKY